MSRDAPPLGPEPKGGNGATLAFFGLLAAVALMVAAGVLTFVYVRHLQQEIRVTEARAERLTFTPQSGPQALRATFSDSKAKRTANDLVWMERDYNVLGTNAELHELTKTKKGYDEAAREFYKQGIRLYRYQCYMAEAKNRSWSAGYCTRDEVSPR